MQAITQALREREASLLTLQALEDGREKTQRGISMADENSSDRKRCAQLCQLSSSARCLAGPMCATHIIVRLTTGKTGGCQAKPGYLTSALTWLSCWCRAQKARALRDDLAALEAASEAAQGEYDKLTDRNQKVRRHSNLGRRWPDLARVSCSLGKCSAGMGQRLESICGES